MAHSDNTSKEKPDYLKILFKEAMNITSLAHYARIQANEAELRARYCMSLADKAMCEAESVHQVSESLTCTSKMVANMTLEYICSLFQEKDTETNNFRDISSEEKAIIETLRQMGTPEKFDGKSYHESERFESRRYSSHKQGDFEKNNAKFLKKNLKSAQKDDEIFDSSIGILVDNVHIDYSDEHLNKFQEHFPELMLVNKEQNTKDLPKDFDSSHSLPIVYEDSYNLDKFQEHLPELMLENKEQTADNLPKESDSSHSLSIAYEDSYHLDKFQEQFPELLIENKEQNAKDLPKEFDSSHFLPIVYEDSYQGARETKPESWSKKKTIRKVQRKLREIDLDGNELDNDGGTSTELVDGESD